MEEHANRPSATIARDVGKAKPDAERAEQMERFRILLSHLERTQKMSAAMLSRAIGRDRSTISAGKTRGVSAELRELLRDKIGVEPRYWSSPTRLDPAECLIPVGPRTSAAEARAAIARQRIIDIARAHHQPIPVLGELASIDPPRGREDDAWWWIEQYFTVTDAFHAKSRKAAG